MFGVSSRCEVLAAVIIILKVGGASDDIFGWFGIELDIFPDWLGFADKDGFVELDLAGFWLEVEDVRALHFWLGMIKIECK